MAVVTRYERHFKMHNVFYRNRYSICWVSAAKESSYTNINLDLISLIEEIYDMITDTQRRNQILRRISRIPKDKLKELDDYVSRLEQDINEKSRILSFAGCWQDIDDSTFDDLTENLIQNRQKNRGRINE